MKNKTSPSIRRQALPIFLLAFASLASAQNSATLTLAEGKLMLLRGTGTFSVAQGARLETGDMIATGPKGQAQLEFADGLIVNLGPESKLYLQDLSRGADKPLDVALASGWLKIASSSGKGETRALLPGIAMETADATLVVHAAAGLDESFVESGTAKATELGRDGAFGNSIAAKGSDYVSRSGGAQLAPARPPQAFLSGLPRHFRDKLPVLIGKAKDAKAEPVREHDTTFAEAEPWLKSNPVVRKGLFARYQTRIKDPEFKSAVAANIAELPEWERAVGAARKK